MGIKTWQLQYDVSIEAKGRNTFFMEFKSDNDLYTVLNKDIWFFKGEMVAIKKVTTKEEADKGEVSMMEMSVQVYGDAVNFLVPESIPKILMERKVGIPISEAQMIFFRGVRGYKVQMMVSLNDPVKDMVEVRHRLLGTMKMFLVYDKITKICTYCAFIGHVKEMCYKRTMVMRFRARQDYRDDKRLWSIPDQNIGDWVYDRKKIPFEKDEEMCANSWMMGWVQMKDTLKRCIEGMKLLMMME